MKVAASLSSVLLPPRCASSFASRGRKSKIVWRAKGSAAGGGGVLRWSRFTPLSRRVAHALAHGGAASACP